MKRFVAAYSGKSVAIKSVAACAVLSWAAARFYLNSRLDTFRRVDGRKRLIAVSRAAKRNASFRPGAASGLSNKPSLVWPKGLNFPTSSGIFGQSFCKSGMPKDVRLTVVPLGDGIPLRVLEYPIVATLNCGIEVIPLAVSLQFDVLGPPSIASGPLHSKANQRSSGVTRNDRVLNHGQIWL